MFSAKISMKVYKQRIYRKQGRKKQKILHQSRKILQKKQNSRERKMFQAQKILLKKMISLTLTHRLSGKVWKKPGLWTGS